MITIPEEDTQFETHTVSKVEPHNIGGYDVTFDDGWCYFIQPSDVVPVIGDEVRLYGKGIGYTVRGVTVNGIPIFYRTEEEEKARHEQFVVEREHNQLREYMENQSDYMTRIAALPEAFQKRIAGFVARKGDSWMPDFLPYELFVCEQAVLFVTTLKTPEEIRRFNGLEWDEQKKLVPDLDEGHSGNTFGAACVLGLIYLEKPEVLEQYHGALCPLVGCSEYGCWASIFGDEHPVEEEETPLIIVP